MNFSYSGPNIHVKVLVLWGHTQYTSIDRILAIFDPLLVEKHRHLANPPPHWRHYYYCNP